METFHFLVQGGSRRRARFPFLPPFQPSSLIMSFSDLSHSKVNLGRLVSRLERTLASGVEDKTWWEVRKLSEVRPFPSSLPLNRRSLTKHCICALIRMPIMLANFLIVSSSGTRRRRVRGVLRCCRSPHASRHLTWSASLEARARRSRRTKPSLTKSPCHSFSPSPCVPFVFAPSQPS